MTTTRQFIITFCFSLSAAMAAILAGCNGYQEKERQQSLEEISKQELATALSERDQLLALVKEVSAGLEQIKQLESIMAMSAAHPNENAVPKARILADIARIKDKIQQRKAQLQELETDLQHSTINAKELKETIGALRVQMDSQIEVIEGLRQQLTAANEQIGALNSAVDSLNTTVTAVTGERNAAREASERLENELNVCYYVVAEKSDLKSHDIIESRFLRKTRLMKGDFDKGFFTTGDKRQLDMLPLNSKKAKILTNHPEASYELADGDEGLKVLRITNPAQFWSLTDYLVVQTD